jgi:hypothetical protein
MTDLDLSAHVPIQSIRSIESRFKKFPDTIRESFVVRLEYITLAGRNIHYPNCLLQNGTRLINPYDERVMSLQKNSFYDGDTWVCAKQPSPVIHMVEPVYFFVYNVDNYYHFIYDTLPYLYGYFELRKHIPQLHLLIQTSHPTKNELPPFVKECLKNLGVHNCLFADPAMTYVQMYVGTSLTHGRHSNSPPSPQAYSVWERFTSHTHSFPKRIYVSRRSWIHGQTKNMGTNYTNRRKCVNEAAVVEKLREYDIIEVFTELLTTEQKITMFRNAEVVVGVIGGGMCNLLLSPQTTKSLCITTPEFMTINNRFKYSMYHTQLMYSNSTCHTLSYNKYRLYSRVKVVNPQSPAYGQIGEIEEHLPNAGYSVRMSSNDVAGFSQDFQMEGRVFREWELECLDNGLNAPYVCNIQQLEADLKKLLEID